MSRRTQVLLNIGAQRTDDVGVAAETIDTALLDGARGGDPFSWAEIYDDCQPRAAAYLSMMGAPALAEDERRVWASVAEAVGSETAGESARSVVLRVARQLREKAAQEPRSNVELDRLADLEREVVALRVGAGLSEEETAVVLGRPVTVVKAAGHRAVAAVLREMPT